MIKLSNSQPQRLYKFDAKIIILKMTPILIIVLTFAYLNTVAENLRCKELVSSHLYTVSVTHLHFGGIMLVPK